MKKSDSKKYINEIKKIKTHIDGFDEISRGGIPEHRSTLIAGSSGSGKTIFSIQFLVNGINYEKENAVFITFEENPDSICQNMLSFNWDIKKLIDEKKFILINASSLYDIDTVGDYNLSGLVTRIEQAIKSIDAKRIVIDSLGSLLFQFNNDRIIRREVFMLADRLKEFGVTVLMTAERTKEYGDVSRYGIEEFVTDNVIILRNTLEEEKRRRTIEILKYRGAFHQKGEYPYTILPGKGVIGTALCSIDLNQAVSNERISSGSENIDKMCKGGLLKGSIVLISGATGTGKTLLVTEFMKGGAKAGEKSILFAFEESKDQILRNAMGWNIDYEKMQKDGLLKIIALYPETMNLEEHLIEIKREIEEFQPSRIAIDSLSALERICTSKSIKEFVIGLTAYIKQKQISTMITATAPTIIGASTITTAHISTITDTIILLRYLEYFGTVKRGMTILKMRGSDHDKSIREFTIDENGMNLMGPFRNVHGILTGFPRERSNPECESL
ncbi:MAG: circadian clock protein KaiC [bacterium]